MRVFFVVPQALVSELPLPAASLLASELQGHVLSASLDTHGSWGVCACYKRTHLPFILADVCEHLPLLSIRQHGCRVVQRVLAEAAACGAGVSRAAQVLLSSDLSNLAVDPYGNYAVQVTSFSHLLNSFNSPSIAANPSHHLHPLTLPYPLPPPVAGDAAPCGGGGEEHSGEQVAAAIASSRHFKARLKRRRGNPHACLALATAGGALPAAGREEHAEGAHRPPVWQLRAAGAASAAPSEREGECCTHHRAGGERHVLRTYHRHALRSGATVTRPSPEMRRIRSRTDIIGYEVSLSSLYIWALFNTACLFTAAFDHHLGKLPVHPVDYLLTIWEISLFSG